MSLRRCSRLGALALILALPTVALAQARRPSTARDASPNLADPILRTLTLPPEDAGSTGNVSGMSVTGGGQTTTLGSMLGALPGLSPSVAGTGTGGLALGGNGWFLHQTNGGSVGTFRAQREVSASYVGTTGNTLSALWGLTYTGRNEASYEWAVKGEVHNRTLASTHAEHVAVNGTIFKEGDSNIEISSSWGGNFLCADLTGRPDPIAACLGAEIAVSAKAIGTDQNRQRVGLQIAMAQAGNPGGTTHVAYGMLMGPGPNVINDRAISIRGGGVTGIGLDTAAATITGAAVYLGGGQRIAFDGSDDGTYARSLRYDGGSASWAYETISGGTPTTRFAVGDNGVVTFGRVTANSSVASLSLSGSSVVGLDLASSTLSGPAIRLASGHEVAWESTGTYKSGFYSGVGYGWKVGNATVLAVDGNGNTTMPGRVTAASYSAGSTVGVSCPAGSVNAGTLVITNGIVTHC